MSARANVQSTEPLQHMRLAMLKFGEVCSTALGDAESDVQRTMNWLETEARTYWQGQLARRQAHVTKCQEAVRMKKLFKDATGKPQSAVEEEKALKVAQRAFEEAIQKSNAVLKYTNVLRKESEIFRTVIQRLGTMLQQDVPTAAARLDSYIMQIEQYATLATPDVGLSSAANADYQSASGIDPAHAGQMTRATDQMPPNNPGDIATPRQTAEGNPSAEQAEATGPQDADAQQQSEQADRPETSAESNPEPVDQTSTEARPPEGETHGRA